MLLKVLLIKAFLTLFCSLQNPVQSLKQNAQTRRHSGSRSWNAVQVPEAEPRPNESIQSHLNAECCRITACDRRVSATELYMCFSHLSTREPSVALWCSSKGKVGFRFLAPEDLMRHHFPPFFPWNHKAFPDIFPFLMHPTIREGPWTEIQNHRLTKCFGLENL